MRDRYEEFTDEGAEVVAIGMGIPEMAAYFRDEYKIPFPLIVDHTKQTYRALELKRGGPMDLFSPEVLIKGTVSFLRGHTQRTAKQDWHQLGGAVVADAGGKIRFVHRSDDASDNVPVDGLLAALVPADPRS